MADVDPQPEVPADLAQGCGPAVLRGVGLGLRAGDPCRTWVSALAGRVSRVSGMFGGSYWARDSAGRGVFATCQHCFEAEGGLVEPVAGNKRVAWIQPPIDEDVLVKKAEAGDSVVHERSAEDIARESAVSPGYVVFAPEFSASAKNDRGQLVHIDPRHDFVVLTVPGDVHHITERGLPEAPTGVSKTPAIHRDPRDLTSAREVSGTPRPGEPIIAFGFPGGQMVYTVTTPLSDEAAAERVQRAEAEEARFAYDPEVEFLFPARSEEGCSGGGVFDRYGRFLGVMVRSSEREANDGAFTRVVRATYIAKQLQVSVEAADPQLRERVQPFVAPILPR